MYSLTYSAPGQQWPDHLWSIRLPKWEQVVPILREVRVANLDATLAALSPEAIRKQVLADGPLAAGFTYEQHAWQDNELECLDKDGNYNGYILTLEGVEGTGV